MQPNPPDPAEPSDTGRPVPVPVPPELLAFARQTFDMKEYLEGVREIQETGGHSFESLIAEVETRVRGS